MDWNNAFTDYAIFQARLYRDDKSFLRYLQYPSIAGCLNESYRVLVRNKTLPPIETLEQEEKVTIWNQSSQYATERKDREKISRAIYLLQMLTS